MKTLASIVAVAGFVLTGLTATATAWAEDPFTGYTRPPEAEILSQGVATNPDDTYDTTPPGCGCQHYEADSAMPIPDTSPETVYSDGRDVHFTDREQADANHG